MYNNIKTIFNKALDVVLGIIAAALCLMMVVVFLQTFTRFVIFHSLPWSEELSRYLFVTILLLGLSVAIRDDMLISIDLIDTIVKGRGQAVLRVIRPLAGLLVCIMIVANAMPLLKVGMIQKSPAMLIPMVIMYGVVFVGYILAGISTLFKVIDAVIALVHPDKEVA